MEKNMKKNLYIYMYLYLDIYTHMNHFVVSQNATQHCKSTILQLKKKKKKKECLGFLCSHPV